jgi:beta-glucuronidase
MLRPQRNACRDFLPLDGLWNFRAELDGSDASSGWARGFSAEADVAVPGSLNEQLAERGYRDFAGPAWLSKRFEVPAHFAGKRLRLRLNSADLRASVWLDGEHLGDHEAPFLPAEFELGERLRAGEEALLVVRLDGRLDPAHPLPGIDAQAYQDERRPRDEIHPPVRYDFFPFIGLHRLPQLVAEPQGGFETLRADTDFDVATGAGHARVAITHRGGQNGDPSRYQTRLRLRDAEGALVAESTHPLEAGETAIDLRLPDARPWSPQSPALYRLEAELQRDGEIVDRYTLQIGFRRFAVNGLQMELNGAPVELRGFGMHEDFPVVGKGQLLPLTVKDFELLRWIGANSLRTSHYAYAEETLDMADRRGVLVISEIASVNLDFRRVDASTLPRHCAMIDAQIARDRSHACVVAWSLTNEPGYLAEAEYKAQAGAYFEGLFAHARQLDPSRPLTAANVGGRHGLHDPLYGHCDFLALNRYVGWYEAPAQLDRAVTMLRDELDALAARYGKPILISEFGADAIAGMHASTDQLFTEEYQARFIAAYWRLIERHPAVFGGHVWNFADFRTAQHHRRVVFNHKGVFTRTRDPKMAAWTLRRLWRGESVEGDYAP